ncbi:MAG: flavodoxin [Firmicutes bacterium]|jgi:flavodoxin|nr:flavodoxin [Bacillota bacterium]
MKKVLVAYFSASGVTKKVAEKIAAAVNGDLFQIEPAIAYSEEDLNWMNKNSRSSLEMSDKDFRPAMIKTELNLSEYDSILLGFPIWWYVAPTIINTFLESYDFSGKKITLFATSGGSGFGNTVQELRNSAPDAHIVEGKIMNMASAEDIQKLIEEV